jgi:formate dehydrogenase subunit gamma
MGIDLRLLRYREATAELAPASKTKPAVETVVRFDPHQRVQHFLMMSSFITLALTGLPQKFSDLSLSQWWVSALGGLEMVRIIHRTAGIIMLTDCLYHLTYLFYRIGVQGKFGPLRMIPTPKDGIDMARTILYFLGLQREKPKFDRFTYLEKFDYWAVFWGIVMIGGSGLVLLFPLVATSVLPAQVIPLGMTIHSDEAVLAVGWILIVHMFNVHLAPWVFPFNPAIFTGRLTAHQVAEDHPLEWERIVAARNTVPRVAVKAAVAVAPAKAGPKPAAMPKRHPARRAAGWLFAAPRATRAQYRKLWERLAARRAES